MSGKFQSPQWGSNSKVARLAVQFRTFLFQSPQWGSNSKVYSSILYEGSGLFQSPQWGSNSKVKYNNKTELQTCFSPRNGEVILKVEEMATFAESEVSVPAMGK